MEIAYSSSILSKHWKNEDISWEAFVDKLREPIVTSETAEQFKRLDKDAQLKIKDVGGFVGGYLSSGKRSKGHIMNRSLIALDADYANNDLLDMYKFMLGYKAVIHSTHKSTPDNLRLRVLIPLTRSVNPIEYEAIARKLAQNVGLQYFDKTTFQPGRLMFWPSIPSDVDYVFEEVEGPILDPDLILGQYVNWQDMREWPGVTTQKSIPDFDDTVANPTEKEGLVGLFCRTYSIYEAIEKFLPDIYKYEGEDRYTYIPGTTKAGVVIYEGLYSYSYHGSDPATGRLCNAYDLVRIHKFGGLDTPNSGEKASNKAMQDFIITDAKVKQQMAHESFETAKLDFASPVINFKTTEDNSAEDWVSSLQMDKSGKFINSAYNIVQIIKNDTNIKDAFANNSFDEKNYLMHAVPWHDIDKPSIFNDADYAGLRNYLECIYGIVAPQKVDDSLQLEFLHKQFHPIRKYLEGLTWDGIERVNYLLQDYFGADDTDYTKAVMRLVLCAAVARVFEPGKKFDYVMVLVGEQATYKSTFIAKLGQQWFSDTFITVQGKESFEQLRGAWLIEIAELAGFRRSEIETIKHFITKCEDSYRAAYARTITTYKRQCIFIGTTNSSAFLHDSTGNRRFLPIQVKNGAIKNVADDLTQEEIDQIWAEAYNLYKNGEKLYLPKNLTIAASEEQKDYTEFDSRQGLIEAYLNIPIPDNWDSMGLSLRQDYLSGAEHTGRARDVVALHEIWCECLGQDRAQLTRKASKELHDIMLMLPGWEYVNKLKTFSIYGRQRYYKRKQS